MRCNVSVVIPTYNRAQFLARAVLSVCRQTCQCREIIVIDDGSNDGSAVLVNKLAETSHIPIRYLYHENRGPAAARNHGIRVAAAEIISFLDSDDHWHRKKLELQYGQLLEQSDFMISHTMEKWLRRGEHLNQKIIHIPRHGDIFTHCLKLCAVGMSTVMVKKTLFAEVGLFDETLPCCEDYDMWLRVSALYPFLLVAIPLTVKEGGRDDQVSTRYRVGMDKFRLQSLENLLSRQVLAPFQREITIKTLVEKAEIYGKGCVKHGRSDEGIHFLALAEKYRGLLSE